jgi:hypothetical protein
VITIVVSRTDTITVDTDDIEKAYALANEATCVQIDWSDDFVATDHVVEEDL